MSVMLRDYLDDYPMTFNDKYVAQKNSNTKKIAAKVGLAAFLPIPIAPTK